MPVASREKYQGIKDRENEVWMEEDWLQGAGGGGQGMSDVRCQIAPAGRELGQGLG